MPPPETGYWLAVYGVYAGRGLKVLESTRKRITKTTSLIAFLAKDLFPIPANAANDEKHYGSCAACDLACTGLFIMLRPETLGITPYELAIHLQSPALEVGRLGAQGKPIALLIEPGADRFMSSVFQGTKWNEIAEADFRNKSSFYKHAIHLSLELFKTWLDKREERFIQVGNIIDEVIKRDVTPDQFTLRDIFRLMHKDQNFRA
jgi:hypothetical protein